MTTTVAHGVRPSRQDTAPSGAFTRLLRQLMIDSGYLFSGMPLAIVSMALLITGLSLSVGLLVIMIGIPVATVTMHIARLFADIERLRLPAVLRRPAPRPRYRRARAGAGFWRRVLAPLADGQSWLDVAHGILMLPLSVATWSVLVVWWSGALGGTFTFAYDWAIPRGSDDESLSQLLGMGDSTTARIGLYTAIGLFFLLTLPLVVRGCALVQAAVGRATLSGLAELQNRITGLEEQKEAAASAESHALRRLERDIHDGPQQRLVRLAMDLGRARQQLATDPAAADATIEEALLQTRETLDELRGLSRGIAPPILTDRGLPAAIAALAGRSTATATLSVDAGLANPARRPAPVVENTAYFVVAEALTNIAKHSQATACSIFVTRSGKRLQVVVTDTGVGGAHVAKGHGLAGLSDRVHAAGGALTVASPAGGPTEIRADLPCE